MSLSARSDVVPLEPEQFKEGVVEIHLQQNFRVAIATLLVYDTIITLDKEVKYFWKPLRRPVDFIYFINRYSGIFGAVSILFNDSFTAILSLCKFSQLTRDIANWITVISIDYIIIIRVLALCSQEKTLSICLKTLLALEAVSKIGIIAYVEILEHIVVATFSDISLCAQIGVIPWQLGMVDWLIPSAFGALLMILALYKAAEYWRLSRGFTGFTLVKILIQDQIVYFLLVISCSVFGILEFRVAPSNGFLANVLNALANPAFLSLLGSRMLFNLKEAGERGQNEGTSYRIPSGTMSGMDFAAPVNPQRESGLEHSGSEPAA